MENHNTKILNYVHENAEMGVQTITKILGCVEDADFDAVLSKQLNQYRTFQDEAQEGLARHNTEAKHVSKMTTVMSNMMIDIKTMRDCSVTKIAEMMLQGSTMGIINATKIVNQNKDADESAIGLATRLLEFEENEFNNIKMFL